LEEGLREISNGFIRTLIKTYLEEIDKEVIADKTGRKKRSIVVERRNDNSSVFTGYIYPVENVAGLESYEKYLCLWHRIWRIILWKHHMIRAAGML
jgi:hypothetical protein